MKIHRFNFRREEARLNFKKNIERLILSLVVVMSAAGAVLFSSFKTSNKETVIPPSFYKPEDNERFKVPLLINKGDITSVCLSPAYMLNAWYDVERIDTISTILDLAAEGKKMNDNYYQFSLSASQEEINKNASNVGLIVVADTVNELSMVKQPIWARGLFNHKFFDEEGTVLQDDTLVQHVKSFPIYVVNTSWNKHAKLELQDGSIMMVVEAMDESKNWKPIEYWSNRWCGNSYYTLLLPPRHMVFTRGIKCSGDYDTKCRLRVSNNKEIFYSNEFIMTINKAQFEKPVIKDRRDE